MLKSYTYRKGNDYVSSDYPPYDFQWHPKRRFSLIKWLRGLILPLWVEWALFLSSVWAFCWAIITALKTVWPGMF